MLFARSFYPQKLTSHKSYTSCLLSSILTSSEVLSKVLYLPSCFVYKIVFFRFQCSLVKMWESLIGKRPTTTTNPQQKDFQTKLSAKKWKFHFNSLDKWRTVQGTLILMLFSLQKFSARALGNFLTNLQIYKSLFIITKSSVNVSVETHFSQKSFKTLLMRKFSEKYLKSTN